jgi:hypothetical protein
VPTNPRAEGGAERLSGDRSAGECSAVIGVVEDGLGDTEDLVALREPEVDTCTPRRRCTRRIFLVLAALIGALVLGGVAGFFYLTGKLGDNVQLYSDVFGPLDQAARPAAGPALTFLLVGTDSRAPGPTTGTDAPADQCNGTCCGCTHGWR